MLLPVVRAGEEEPKPIENSTNQTFIVEKCADGSFLLRSSPFFNTLGQRPIGFVIRVVLALMVGFTLLAFWAWMGLDAWWARPRRRFWRAFVLIPALGAVVYFLCAYLPARLKN